MTVYDDPAVLRIPSGTTVVDEETFAGTNAEFVELPGSLSEVKADAFADTPVKQLAVFGSETMIDPSAFDSDTLSELTVLGYHYSRAKEFAIENGCMFMALD